MQPLRHIKNGFPPETQHGIDEYGKYSVYALYCSSVLGLAALYADDSIDEYACPSEIGGYILELYPAFHKIFASTKTSQIEIDTDADPHYEATGLGRFQVKGVPIELGLSMSFSAHPSYRLHDSLKPREAYAIGPSWKTGKVITSLAAGSNIRHRTKLTRLGRDTIGFNVEYRSTSADSPVVAETYLLAGNELRIHSSLLSSQPVDTTYFTIPLLVSDGNNKSSVDILVGNIRVAYMGHYYTIQFDKALSYEIRPTVFANRNGIYRNLVVKKPGNTIQVSLQLE